MTLRALAVACLVAVALPPAARAAPWEVTVVDKGQDRPRVIYAPRKTQDAVMIVAFRVGAVDDGIKSGLTRLTQHMMIEGNARADASSFRRELYASAAELTLTTEVRQATFRLHAPRGEFEDLAERLLEMTLAPKLVAAALPRARRLTQHDEMVSGSTEDLISFVAASVIMMEGGEEGGDYNSNPYGEPEVVKRLAVRDVEQHIEKKLTPANATVIFAGNFDKKKMEKTLARYRGGKRRAPERPDVVGYLPMQFDRWARREIHLQAQVVDLTSPEQAAAARMLNALLQERMTWQLRKLGVTYGSFTFPVRREWLDFIVVEVPVAGNEDVLVEPELKKLLAGVASGELLPGELERNREYALREMDLVDSDAGLLADSLFETAGRVQWHSREVRDTIASMSQAQLLAHARPWLSEGRSINFLFGKTRRMPMKRGEQR